MAKIAKHVLYVRFTYKIVYIRMVHVSHVHCQDVRRIFVGKVRTVRKDIRVPETLVKQVEDFQREKGIAFWTTALLELARRGLEEYRKEDDESPHT